jgi:glutamate N-acetyltransferase/amino-acid N-acetyltransferase
MDKVSAGIHEAADVVGKGRPDGTAAEAIMTTDTVPKEIVVEVATRAGTFRVGAIAKGSGMIAPNMATMLAFVVTDLGVDATTLDGLLRKSVDQTYNMVSVDHDTSTNDMVLAMANGASGLVLGRDVRAADLGTALEHVNAHLARAIARDGEGATKLLEVHVAGAADAADARRAAKAVVDSSLVKTAVHGADPNWGRVLAALGYSGARLEPDRVRLALGDAKSSVDVLSMGEPLAFDREAAAALMRSETVRILIDMGLGDAKAVAYGCDLSREYVDINAHYTT